MKRSLTIIKTDEPIEHPLKITPDTYRYFRNRIAKGRARSRIPVDEVNMLMSKVLRVIARDKILDAVLDGE